jgi:hypothetical protein
VDIAIDANKINTAPHAVAALCMDATLANA